MSLPSLRREEIGIACADGWVLRGELICPEAPRAVAVLGHAMMVNRSTMDRGGDGLATTLAQRGIAVFNMDLRGHGASGPTAREGAQYGLDDFIRFDLPAMVTHARERFPGLGVAAVGHSLAGTSALLAAGLFPDRAADAIVTLAANIGLLRHEPSLYRRAVKLFLYVTWGALTAPFGRIDPVPFRIGTDAESWAYTRQYVRIALTGKFRSEDGADDYTGAMARVTCPVLCVASEGDPILGRPDAVFRFADELVRAPVEKRRLEGPGAPSHMGIVTSRRSRPHWEGIADWILERLARAP